METKKPAGHTPHNKRPVSGDHVVVRIPNGLLSQPLSSMTRVARQ